MGDEISRFQIASLETRRKRWNWAGLDATPHNLFKTIAKLLFRSSSFIVCFFLFSQKALLLNFIILFYYFEPHLQLLPPPPLSLLSLRNMAIHHLA